MGGGTKRRDVLHHHHADFTDIYSFISRQTCLKAEEKKPVDSDVKSRTNNEGYEVLDNGD